MSAPIAPARLPFVAAVPDDVSVDEVLADLADDGVSAPDADVEGLRDAVARAQEHGIDLKIVVVDSDPGRPEPLRDLATEIGSTEGGTVLVLSPGSPGTYSDTISRVVLEGAQDRTYTGSAVESANNFVDDITGSHVSWGLVTAVLVLVVALVAGASYVAKARRGPARPDAQPGDTADVPAGGRSHVDDAPGR